MYVLREGYRYEEAEGNRYIISPENKRVAWREERSGLWHVPCRVVSYLPPEKTPRIFITIEDMHNALAKGYSPFEPECDALHRKIAELQELQTSLKARTAELEAALADSKEIISELEYQLESWEH